MLETILSQLNSVCEDYLDNVLNDRQIYKLTMRLVALNFFTWTL